MLILITIPMRKRGWWWWWCHGEDCSDGGGW